MRSRFAKARESFWFLPALLGIAAVALAQSLIVIDRRLDGTDFGVWGVFLYRVGASGSRDILGAIGGSMLAVAATSFSITISVLATASSTYGPRLVRNFMADRGNQFVLGIFGATFLYSLMVLRSIRSESTDGVTFVPDIAVNVAVILAVVDVAVLVYFIHHIADSIQVSTLSARVRSELVTVVDALYPESPDEHQVPARAPATTGVEVRASTPGFVVSVHEAGVLSAAHSCDGVVELLVCAGDHVIAGETIARITGTDSTSDIADAVRSAVDTGDTRTPAQDISFAVQQLTEMAVRAMSPSTNDPYTARNALAELAVGLVPLASRPAPLLGRTDEQGTYRLTVNRPPVTDLIDQVFDAMRHYGLGNPIAVIAAAELARRIGTATVHSEIRDCVLRQLAALRRAYEHSDADPIDIEAGRVRIVAASTAITASTIEHADRSSS
ncbi:MAG: DUF2254 domain-containing protein [Rhodococcus sp. (in: high G+C Gram-positive bacteria)]|uniref:DUF2254 domain-containing protein n=1 Tax=Rhodococcus sp. TaxID=1831 RepID=UPI002ADAF727|nr:DUF2254 domain-containing protein [Rhodococcus sp. (in: high G+C Gram-positive bacteria)]